MVGWTDSIENNINRFAYILKIWAICSYLGIPDPLTFPLCEMADEKALFYAEIENKIPLGDK